MKPQDGPDRISAALRRLAPPRASAGFTDGVLARLAARDARRRQRRATRIALVAGAALVAAVAATLFVGRPEAPAASTSASAIRTEEMREEYRRLQAELERLRRVSERDAVLYLGGSGDYDLVLDLSPLLDQRVDSPVVPAMQDLRVRPAQARTAERREP